jgi:maleylacetate reductase
MQPFVYNGLPVRVRFDAGALAKIEEEASALGIRRAMLIATPAQAATAQDFARSHPATIRAVFTDAQMHTPFAVTERAVRIVQDEACDGLIALGGGSTIGLGKAIALRTDLPQIAIPTTYAGSEATPILGETKDGVKTTIRDMRVLPEVILYDVDLTLTLPIGLSMTSGLNAIAHAAEALYSRDGNPLISLLAEDGIRAMASALPAIRRDPQDPEARAKALYGAWACGTCLGAVGMSLHHKLCHTLGGSFDLPHAETHAILLPHSIAYNQAAAPQAMQRIAAALGTRDAAEGLFALARRIGAPSSLQAIGMHPGDVERAADLAVANPYWSPRPVEREAIRKLLHNAFHGLPPEQV